MWVIILAKKTDLKLVSQYCPFYVTAVKTEIAMKIEPAVLIEPAVEIEPAV